MSSVHLGTFCTSAVAAAYEIGNGNFAQAAAIPTMGYAIYKMGDYWDLEEMKAIGHAIMYGSFLTAPGTVLGYALYILDTKSLTMKILAATTATAITYLMMKGVLQKAPQKKQFKS